MAEIQQFKKNPVRLLRFDRFQSKMKPSEKFTLIRSNNYRLQKADPILTEGLLKVGIRLQNVSMKFEVKDRVTVFNKHCSTGLIITRYSEAAGNEGENNLLNSVRGHFR